MDALPTTTAWPRVPPTTLADQAYQVVRARILGGLLPAGEFIRERDVHEALGISRTPVREALTRLASEGVLEHVPHRGFRVPESAPGEPLELYPIIRALELLAGRLALPRLGSSDLARLRSINERLRAALDHDDAHELVQLNNHFHHLIGECGGNRRLCELLDHLRSQLTVLDLRSYSDRQHALRSIREHDALIHAIEQGDHELALRILEHNL